ncbi:TetR/AcrR family transcriptional regulator [Paenibacillus sp. FA6]|uniref:TetR/AcrR family transcriptional regulator n=1 Tax=Paenibacillus sp. FA6 TaxID=3413029 RepID=UPI003F65CD30
MIKRNLRYTKKEATIKALADAAFELALERGLDDFVVEDVVQRAGYSRRTFANHFFCKEEAVVTGAYMFNDTIEVENLLADLSEDTPLLDVLFQLIKMQLTLELFRKVSKLVILCEKHPSLKPYFLDQMSHMQNGAYYTLMEISNEKYDEVYIHLLVGAVYGAILPVLNGSLNVLLPEQTLSDTSFHQYLDKIYEYLRNGFNY